MGGLRMKHIEMVERNKYWIGVASLRRRDSESKIFVRVCVCVCERYECVCVCVREREI
jgi:hypothetical protein